LESLRELVIKLCYLLENKYILIRKQIGYIYLDVNQVGNSLNAKRNRNFLALAKAKNQREIRKMATQYNSFTVGTDKGRFSFKLLPPDFGVFRNLADPLVFLHSRSMNRKTTVTSEGGPDEDHGGTARTASKQSSDMKRKGRRTNTVTLPKRSGFSVSKQVPSRPNESVASGKEEEEPNYTML
jgi:hypothetical protein